VNKNLQNFLEVYHKKKFYPVRNRNSDARWGGARCGTGLQMVWRCACGTG